MRSKRFDMTPTPLRGLYRVDRQRLDDARGHLTRLYGEDDFADAGLDFRIAQVNHTLTRRQGSVRGMHFQNPPHAETKLVSCLRGEIFDVAVDLRTDSPTFMRWHGERLSAENGRALLIPPGFAHGFQTLCDDCELVYLHSASYHPAAEGAVHAQDPRLAIAWPLPVGDLSERDRSHPFVTHDFRGIAV